MSDKETVKMPFEKIKRGETEVPVIWKEKKKGDSKGSLFPSVEMLVYKPGEKEDELGDLDEESTLKRFLNTYLPFLGITFVAKKLNATFNLLAQTAMAAAEDKDDKGEGLGTYNWEKVKQYIEELSAKTDSIPEMEAEMKRLGLEMTELFAEMRTGTPEQITSAQQRGMKISDEITRLNNMIESRKRGPRESRNEDAKPVAA